MKGLLIKDFMLLKNQLRFFAIAVLIVFLFPLAGLTDASFMVMYGTVMFSMFSLSSITYDEYENGAPYLFALPISRNGYVREKYVFGLLLTLIPGIVLGSVSILFTAFRSPETDIREVLFLIVFACFMSLLFQAVMIPLQLKFGGDKSRIAMLMVVGAGLITAVLVLKGMQAAHFDLDAALQQLERASALTILGTGGVIMGILLLLSGLISTGIMRKKEF